MRSMPEPSEICLWNPNLCLRAKSLDKEKQLGMYIPICFSYPYAIAVSFVFDTAFHPFLSYVTRISCISQEKSVEQWFLVPCLLKQIPGLIPPFMSALASLLNGDC